MMFYAYITAEAVPVINHFPVKVREEPASDEGLYSSTPKVNYFKNVSRVSSSVVEETVCSNALYLLAFNAVKLVSI